MHSESELCDLGLSCPFWDQTGDTTARLLQGGSCWDSASHERFHGTEKSINVILPEQAGTLGFSLVDLVVCCCRQWSCCFLIQHPEKSYSDTIKSQGNREEKIKFCNLLSQKGSRHNWVKEILTWVSVAILEKAQIKTNFQNSNNIFSPISAVKQQIFLQIWRGVEKM